MATIIQSIASGKYDNSLDRILEACRRRKEERIYSLRGGDKVRFSTTVRPQYLQGATAVIVSWRRSRVLVQLEDGQYLGRYRGGKILAHPSGLIPVEDPS